MQQQSYEQNHDVAHLLINLWRLKTSPMVEMILYVKENQYFHQRMTSKTYETHKMLQKLIQSNHFAHLLINLWRLNTSRMLEMLLYNNTSIIWMKGWCLKTYATHKTLQQTMKLQSFGHLLINLWCLKTPQMLEMLLYAMKN